MLHSLMQKYDLKKQYKITTAAGILVENELSAIVLNINQLIIAWQHILLFISRIALLDIVFHKELN